MKTRILLLCSLLSLTGSLTLLAGTKKHVIKFTVNGLKNTVCYMCGHQFDRDYIYDTAKVDAKGNFQFVGDKELDGGIYFLISATKQKMFEFIIDKDQKFSMQADTADYVKTMKVQGSEENKLFYEFQEYATETHKKMDSLGKQARNGPDKVEARKKLDSLIAQSQRYRRNFIASHSDMFMSKVLNTVEEPIVPPAPILSNGRKDSTFAYRYYKAHYWDNVDFSDPRLIHTTVLFPKIKEYLAKVIAPQTLIQLLLQLIT